MYRARLLVEASEIHLIFYRMSIVVLAFGILLVAWSNRGDGGNSSEPRCDFVASTTSNPTAYFKVINRLNGGLTWHFSNGPPFGDDMEHNACTFFGLSPRGYSVIFQQCNVADEACTSSFGPTREVVFYIQNGETYTVQVSSRLFQ